MRMKTEVMALTIPGRHEIIKTINHVVLPYMPEGASLTVDGSVYRVKDYLLVIDGDNNITAQIRVR